MLQCVDRNRQAIVEGTWPSSHKDLSQQFDYFMPPFVKVHTDTLTYMHMIIFTDPSVMCVCVCVCVRVCVIV